MQCIMRPGDAPPPGGHQGTRRVEKWGRSMIETNCQCGAPLSAPESSVGESIACDGCGQMFHLVAAEQLADGNGAGDFDARLIIESGPQRVGEQLLLGG